MRRSWGISAEQKQELNLSSELSNNPESKQQFTLVKFDFIPGHKLFEYCHIEGAEKKSAIIIFYNTNFEMKEMRKRLLLLGCRFLWSCFLGSSWFFSCWLFGLLDWRLSFLGSLLLRTFGFGCFLLRGFCLLFTWKNKISEWKFGKNYFRNSKIPS